MLTGGGARSAYQVGVLRALAEIPARAQPVPGDRRDLRRCGVGERARGRGCTGAGRCGAREGMGELPRRAGVSRRRRGTCCGRHSLAAVAGLGRASARRRRNRCSTTLRLRELLSTPRRLARHSHEHRARASARARVLRHELRDRAVGGVLRRRRKTCRLGALPARRPAHHADAAIT